MGHSPQTGRANLLGVFPQGTGGIDRLARATPCVLAFGHFFIADIDRDFTFDRIQRDDVAILHHRNRTTMRGLGADMAHAEPAGRTGKTAICDQRYLLAHALPRQRSRGCQHFTHTRAACGAFVANDQNLAFLVFTLLHRLERIFFAFEHAGRAAEYTLVLFHSGDFYNRAIGGQIALQANQHHQ